MHHVVIVGGGYGGVAALKKLGDVANIKVTLIDQHPYHYLQTEGYALISGEIPFERTIVSLPALCAYYDNTHFEHKKVISFDKTEKKVICEESEVEYDTLIVAMGSRTKLFKSDKEIRRYSAGAKSLRGALYLYSLFHEELYRRLESDKDINKSFNIIVGGAGLSGVEIAASMQQFFNRFYRQNALVCSNINIYLIASGETVLKGMHKSVIKYATKRLKKLRVNVYTNTRVNTIDKHTAFLSNDEQISFDFMIFAGGTMIPACLETLDLPNNAKGQLEVDDYLRSVADETIYVIGDVASLSDKKGKPLPPTAQTAIESGSVAAQNIIYKQQGKKQHKKNVKIKGIAIALGSGSAVIDMGWIRIYGYLAYLIKNVIEKIYRLPLMWRVYRGYENIDSCKIN